MKQNNLYIILITLFSIMFIGCSDSDSSFDNKIYIDSAAKTKSILLFHGNDTDQASFKVSMPSVEDRDVIFKISGDPSLLGTYNEAYYDNAILLPEGCYEISTPEVTIIAGSVQSPDVTILFSKLTELDRQQRYVLPVSINSAQVGVLSSARTMYYVFRGAALINYVADLEKNNVYVDWKNNEDFVSMSKFTAEALINPRKFDRQLTTVMGIEDKFLIRIGDEPIPPNQLQIATSNGNYTSSDLVIPTNTWTHLAVTYDAVAKEINVFINGKNMLKTATNDIGNVNWGVEHSDESDGKDRCFWIGYSYNNDRYLAGEISECRVWNKVLTAAEINETNHFYFVEPDSKGLIAYWKFNDAGGDKVKDYSINKNDATGSNPIKWNGVQLPLE